MGNRWFKIGGAVIGGIGLISLPADLGTWWERIQDVGGMFADNPASGAALVAGIIIIGLGYRNEILRIVLGKRWRSDEELGEELYGWLRENGMIMQDVPARQGESFAFAASKDGPRVIVVGLGDGRSEVILCRQCPSSRTRLQDNRRHD